jgi:hypothetical protein
MHHITNAPLAGLYSVVHLHFNHLAALLLFVFVSSLFNLHDFHPLFHLGIQLIFVSFLNLLESVLAIFLVLV